MDIVTFLPSDHPGVMPLNTDLPENNVVEEVVIAGERVQRRTPLSPNPTIDLNGGIVYSVWAFNTWNNILPVDQLVINEYFSGGTTPNPLAPPVTVMTLENDPDFAGSLNVAALLEKGILTVEQAISSLSSQQVWQLPRNNTINGFEVALRWDAFAYKVSDIDYGNGAGGAVREAQLFSEVNYKTILTNEPGKGSYYGQGGVSGIYYYLIHELAHTLPAVQAYRDQMVNDYRAYHQAQNTPNFNINNFNASEWGKKAEVFTNVATREVMQSIGLPIWQGAPYGYAYTPTPGQAGPPVAW